MIKLLHIIQDINSGGVEQARLTIAKHIDKKEFQLKIICIRALHSVPDEIRSHDVEVIPMHTFKGIFDFETHKKVQKIINDYKPDIIHGAVFEGVTLAAINGWYKKVPKVVIEETSDPTYRSWRGNLLMKFFTILADYSVGVSKPTTEYLTNKLKVPSKKVRLIFNGVGSANQYPQSELDALKQSLNISDSDFVFISVGRMNAEPIKRFKVLIHAFYQVAKTNKSAKLILIGDGDQKQDYINLVNQLQIQNQVIFTGYQGEVDKYLQIANMFCLYSSSESFGLAAAEAQMCKIPAIVTAVGGLQYLVVNNETGFVVQPNDFDAMANKMLYAFNNKSQIKQMGEKAYNYTLNNYSDSKYIQTLSDFYKEILKK